jgi:hypothetical protein
MCWATAWTKSLQGSRVLRIRVDSPEEPLGQALLDAPWELLADGRGFFADDDAQWFDVARRIGKAGEPVQPKHSDLHALFMAAAPEGTTVLDFEAEEAAIVQATQNLRMHLVVEESGSAPLLTECMAADGPFEALHISCHGDKALALGRSVAHAAAEAWHQLRTTLTTNPQRGAFRPVSPPAPDDSRTPADSP